jgi:type II secretory pathway component GspD/PulD (secretin)
LRILASIVAALALAVSAYASKASDAFENARKLEKAGRIVEAYVLYAEAATLDPDNKQYAAKKAEMQVRATKEQEKLKSPAVVENERLALAPDPNLQNISTRELEQARQMLSPPELKLAGGRFDFHFTGTSTEVFNQVAKRCGLETVLDSEYQSTSASKVRFDIDDVDCRDAIRAAEAATSSFVAPLSSKLILISKDTPQKRQANEQTMSAVVSVPTALTTQDVTEIAQAVKQVTGIEKLAWSAATNEILIRDRVSRVMIAKPLAEQLMAYRGTVMFDLRFLQLSDAEMLEYGIDLTNTFNVIWGGSQAFATVGAPLRALEKIFTRGWQTFGINALQASVVATLTESKSKTVLRTQLRAMNGMPATLHVGDKYPVLTSGYYGPASASTGSGGQGVYTPPPSFAYQDLGVSLKVMPMIGNNDLITLDIDTEYQLLAGQSLNGIPVLANRQMTTRICIHNDEWAVIGGLINRAESKNINGVAGLARLPLLGWLFKTQTREKDRDHIVIVMRPHIIGDPPANNETEPMRVGTETRPLSPI